MDFTSTALFDRVEHRCPGAKLNSLDRVSGDTTTRLLAWCPEACHFLWVGRGGFPDVGMRLTLAKVSTNGVSCTSSNCCSGWFDSSPILHLGDIVIELRLITQAILGGDELEVFKREDKFQARVGRGVNSRNAMGVTVEDALQTLERYLQRQEWRVRAAMECTCGWAKNSNPALPCPRHPPNPQDNPL